MSNKKKVSMKASGKAQLTATNSSGNPKLKKPNSKKRPATTKARQPSGQEDDLAGGSKRFSFVDKEYSKSDYEQQIKALMRDKQALQSKLEQYEARSGKKAAAVEKEKDMRLQANKERYWLRQKLNKMQMAIQARLKLLGIDFSDINDLGEALDAAFSAIQKLSAALAEKEAEIQALNSKLESLTKVNGDYKAKVDKLEKQLKKQKEIIDEQRRDIIDRDRRLSAFGQKTDQFADDRSKFEEQMAKLRSQIEKAKSKGEDQFDKFADKKLELQNALKGKEATIENLQQQLANSNDENDALRRELEALRKQLNDAKGSLAKTSSELSNLKANTDRQANEQAARIKQLEDELEDALKNAKKLNQELEDARGQIEDMEDQIAIQDEELANYKSDADQYLDKSMQLQQQMQESDATMGEELMAANAEKAQLLAMAKRLKEQNDRKDEELRKLKQQLNDARKKLNDYMNRPRDDKAVQTDISGSYFDDVDIKLADLERMRADNGDLNKQLGVAESKLRNALGENQVLLDEIDYLLKQAAKFRPDSSNHTGGVLDMMAAPNKYMAATSATDQSVRLWRINPHADNKKEKQCKVYASSKMEGDALSLAFSKDGTYLAAGTAYKNGPDGAILIWNMSKGDGEVEFLFRSRPTIRFGKVHCLVFSDDNRYVFTGDTTGSVWVWDIAQNLQLAEISMHKDVIHDLSFSGSNLYACALDQNISLFKHENLQKIKIRKDRIHMWEPKKLKAAKLERNDKYPFWKLDTTSDGAFLCAGARRLFIFKVEGDKLVAGPRCSDSDLDHVKNVKISQNMMCICRQNTPRAKIFDIFSGKEMKVMKSKNPVSHISFIYDLQHCLVCSQVWDKEIKPPLIKLWNFKK